MTPTGPGVTPEERQGGRRIPSADVGNMEPLLGELLSGRRFSNISGSGGLGRRLARGWRVLPGRGGMIQEPKLTGIEKPGSFLGDGAQAIQKLAVGAMQGDQRAFGDLHRILTGPFAGFFMKRVGGDVDMAEELAHEAVSEALQGLATGRYHPERAAFLTFVYGVSHKVRLRYIKQKSKERERQLSNSADKDSERVEERSASEDERLPPMDQIEAMRACLGAEGTAFSLSPEERFVVVGRAWRKTFEILAAELGHSLDTVHRRMVRGLEKLRKCMELKGFR